MKRRLKILWPGHQEDQAEKPTETSTKTARAETTGQKQQKERVSRASAAIPTKKIGAETTGERKPKKRVSMAALACSKAKARISRVRLQTMRHQATQLRLQTMQHQATTFYTQTQQLKQRTEQISWLRAAVRKWRWVVATPSSRSRWGWTALAFRWWKRSTRRSTLKHQEIRQGDAARPSALDQARHQIRRTILQHRLWGGMTGESERNKDLFLSPQDRKRDCFLDTGSTAAVGTTKVGDTPLIQIPRVERPLGTSCTPAASAPRKERGGGKAELQGNTKTQRRRRWDNEMLLMSFGPEWMRTELSRPDIATTESGTIADIPIPTTTSVESGATGGVATATQHTDTSESGGPWWDQLGLRSYHRGADNVFRPPQRTRTLRKERRQTSHKTNDFSPGVGRAQRMGPSQHGLSTGKIWNEKVNLLHRDRVDTTTEVNHPMANMGSTTHTVTSIATPSTTIPTASGISTTPTTTLAPVGKPSPPAIRYPAAPDTLKFGMHKSDKRKRKVERAKKRRRGRKRRLGGILLRHI